MFNLTFYFSFFIIYTLQNPFLGVMASRIFLWVQAQDIRRKDDDNDQRVKATAGIMQVEEIKNKKRRKPATARGIPRDNPLTPFNKGDLNNALGFYYRQSWNKGLVNTRRCDTDIVICVYRKYRYR